LLSARAGEEAAVEGLRAGADDYLVKPFSARELLARVQTHVDMARIRDQIEREKDEFLSTAAHDLKSPLTTIKGFTQLLRRQLKRHGVLEAERAEDALQHIEKTATRLAQLITELQDITLIRAGQPLTLQLAPTDLTQLTRDAVEQIEQTIDSHRIELTLPPEQIVLIGDSSRLQRVLSNLLSNAVKYSPLDTSITVSVAREGNEHDAAAAITVVDQGIGIPPTDLPYIFDRFSRGSNVTEDTAGTGIGLASVRQIVEQHRGTMSVESQEGEGSTFRVWLPLTPPAEMDQM
jgi:signal transduction histidine kinase